MSDDHPKPAEPVEIDSSDRRRLKALAHHIEPAVHVGKDGVSPGVRNETNRALAAHELIKVKIDWDDSSARRSMAGQLARDAGAALVGTIGKIAILYRPSPDEPKLLKRNHPR